MKPIELWHGDCLELMKDISDGSVDLVLADPPYGTTACKWDSVIPFEPMWEQLKRIVKRGGTIVLFGSEPFSSLLRISNIDIGINTIGFGKKSKAQADYNPKLHQ